MEAAELAIYLFMACAVATLLQDPDSPVQHFVMGGIERRALMGIAMGATLTAIILSPWGKQSGGHFNPAVTFTYYRLGKVEFWDFWFYLAAQFLGAIGGVWVAGLLLRGAAVDDAARYAVTVPGMWGSAVAFLAEVGISFFLMLVVLVITNRANLARYTAYFVGLLIAAYITFESPLSGMSSNPARTLGPAVHAGQWHALWIYFVAPSLGMLVAAELFLWARNGVEPYCAKLHHDNNKRCIFCHD